MLFIILAALALIAGFAASKIMTFLAQEDYSGDKKLQAI